jgi:superfamily I DNA/RNA helicase
MTPDKLFHRLRDLITQPEVPESEDFVRIMSLQKSKGLTSKAVIVLGCVEGLLPVTDPELSMAERVDLLQDQRRLFYVAVTRPTDMLMLSSFRTIQSALAFKIGAIH